MRPQIAAVESPRRPSELGVADRQAGGWFKTRPSG